MSAPAPASADTAVTWHRLPGPEAAERLGVDPATGLTPDQVRDRTAEVGPNRLPEAPKRPAFLRFIDQFKDFLVGVLAVAAVVSLLVGDVKDPIIIGLVLLFNAILGYIQENRADAALEALKAMLELRVRVRRGGEVVEVGSDALVPGDVVLLEAGDRIPADGRFVNAVLLSVDESALTGESVPVDKGVEAIDTEQLDIGDRRNMGFMNTVLVRGRGELLVTNTGARTEIGRLAGMLSATEERATPLQEQLEALGKRLAAVAGVAVAAVFAVSLIRGETLANALLESVTLAVAAIPEGLPAVVTVTLAIGVHRMAKRNAIVKRLASVETLGGTTVICSDKTGTLTLNQMTATAAWVGGERFTFTGLGYGTDGSVGGEGGAPLDDAARSRLSAALMPGVLCNDAHLTTGDGGRAELVGDPTEGAFVVAAAKAATSGSGDARPQFERLAEAPFDSAVKFMATVHPHPDGQGFLLAVKGAPDVLAARCETLRRPDGLAQLDDAARNEVAAANNDLASGGLRVLAVATRRLDAVPEDPAEAVSGMTLELLIGILDPPREEAKAAIAECHAAGIDFKMITGDHAATAAAIAGQLGITGEVVTGADLDAMSDEQLADRIESIGVCARVSPEHKVRVVRALQSRGHVAAMTGDGVNDAAALKLADIGVAMGITGTEVTKEAADMVLADDNVATIVGAVERGRAIYDNIVTFVRFQLATNVAAITTFLTFRLAGLPAPFNPIQVLFINIIADGPPAMSLGVDAPRPGVMNREPRDRGASILTAPRLGRIGVQAVVMMLGTLGVFLSNRDDEQVALTMAFTTFVFFQMVNALLVRSGNGTVFSSHTFTNGKLWAAIAGVYVMQFLIVQIPFFERVFGTVPLDAAQWGVCLAVPFVLLVTEEITKAIIRRVSPNAEV